MMDRSVLVALSLVSLSAIAKPPPASPSAEEQEALEHYTKGTRLFNLMQYDAAIEEYQAAYKLRDDPRYLYNIAQSSRLAGHVDRALGFYRNYLRLVADSPLRPTIDERIVEMEKVIAAQRTQTASPPRATEPSIPVVNQQLRVVDPPVPVGDPPRSIETVVGPVVHVALCRELIRAMAYPPLCTLPHRDRR